MTHQSHRLLERLGFLMVPNFLSQSACAALRDEMAAAPGRPATVAGATSPQTVDTTVRQLQTRHVSEQALEDVAQRFRSLLPSVHRHYQVPVVDVERPKFLLYQPGDFFVAHADRGESGSIGGNRLVSAVLFLNDEREVAPTNAAGGDLAEQQFSGGTLTFYGVLDDPGFQNLALPMRAQTGLLVTFPSAVQHEVQRVVAGRRYTVVSWFCAS